LAAGGWGEAEPLFIETYPWFKGGQKQQTSVALQYDDKAIYTLFVCEDKHIYAVTALPNGPVCLDSCVEFFATPEPRKGPDYFNFEANCCGSMLLGWGAERNGRKLAGADVFKQIKIVTSIPGPTRGETPGDDGWWLAVAIPFKAIDLLSGRKIAPKSGDEWLANFFRCGGKTDDQYAVWNPIVTEKPDYHRPEQFGRLIFE
jgi:hypothetical protein